MATLTADRHLVQRSLLDPHEEDRVVPRPRRTTLDDLVSGTWDDLLRTHAAVCLMCGASLTPRWSSGPHPVGARCPNCGTELH
jgi:hypothetical protein